MGRPKQFAISFNPPAAVYFGGQVVSGTVTLELEEELTMRALRLECSGRSNVRWSESHGSGKHRRTVTYHNQENYFGHVFELWGKSQNGDKDEMPAGFRTFPFEFRLPPNLPSSFEGSVGNVRYMIKAVIDRKFWFDYESIVAFTVLNHLDLNTQPTAPMPVESTLTKHLCCWCCKSGPITGTLSIPKSGYVPGEAIFIKAQIDNMSNRTMAKTTVKILQVISFHATTKTRSEKQKVAEMAHGEIEPGSSDYWNGERFVIPAVPPSFLAGCRIIDIQYILQLNVDPTGVGFDLKVPVEIIVGSIPLNQATIQRQPQAQQQQQFPSVMPSAFQPPTAPSEGDLYSSALGPAPPPPTYSASVFGEVNINEGGQDKENTAANNYTPVYTYYNYGFTQP